MKPLIITISILLNIIATSATAQTFNVQDFKEVPLPVPESKEWYKLNSSVSREFEVAVVKGALQITKSVYTPTITYTIPQGEVLGINQGEFGGGLFYKPKDTTLKQLYVNGELRTLNTKGDPFQGGLLIPRNNPVNKLMKNAILIENGNINKIFTYKDGLYTMEGLAHMGLSFGAISKLQIKGDSVKCSPALNFDDAPTQIAIDKDKIYLATNDRFYIIRNWQKELLFDKLFWNGLYPNSIAVRDERHVYIGLRGGYAVIDAKNKKLEFYQYRDDLH